jgi:DNA-binding HxlR family transcriptional regulator
VLDLIADKWSILVLSAVHHGVHRNGELLRRIGGISQKALTRTLRELERNGLVRRTDHLEVPPRVDYSLTDTGGKSVPSYRIALHLGARSRRWQGGNSIGPAQ